MLLEDPTTAQPTLTRVKGRKPSRKNKSQDQLRLAVLLEASWQSQLVESLFRGYPFGGGFDRRLKGDGSLVVGVPSFLDKPVCVEKAY